MTTLTCTVNGTKVSEAVEPRTHLADFVRETLLLTGTHLGCEHGVCGACTLLLDGVPVRGCITFAALCEGADIRTIEGFAGDPVMAALRVAFTAAHALQCGFCTPGMLVTARDIVLRLPDADDDRIRLELAGNLCRCTGYNGIVRAIRSVLDDPPPRVQQAAEPLAQTRLPDAPESAPVAAPVIAPGGAGLAETLRIGLPPDQVWAAIQNPEFVALCVPGVRVTAATPDRIEGEMQASLGPIRTRFVGAATIRFDPATRSGDIAGQGQDAMSRTRLTAAARFQLAPSGAGTAITLDITYGLQGPLAQFGRGPVVRVFAAELAAAVAAGLEARLRGTAVPVARFAGGRFLWRVILGLLRRRGAKG